MLVFQALFLAHGGLTTLGANIVAMGVAGPLAACLIFRLGHAVTPEFSVRSFTATLFCAAAAADLVTYMMTSLQLALAYPAAEGGVAATFVLYLGIFGITQGGAGDCAADAAGDYDEAGDFCESGNFEPGGDEAAWRCV